MSYITWLEKEYIPWWRKKQRKLVTEWNKKYPVGQEVILDAWIDIKTGLQHFDVTTFTKNKARLLGYAAIIELEIDELKRTPEIVKAI